VTFSSLSASLFLALTLMAGRALPAAAQTDVTANDVQRLQDNIYDASRDIGAARSRDAALASELQSELDDARDEATYLRVKLGKNERVGRSDYDSLRDRIENIRARARGEATGRSPVRAEATSDDRPNSLPPGRGSSSSANEVPVGTEFDVRLQDSLSSGTAMVEDRFESTTLVDLQDGSGRVIVPAGSIMRGVVSSVNKAGRVERKGSLTVAFDRVTINGKSYPIRATVTQAIESEGIKGEKEKIGIGAGAGAILGAILGGVKGAVAGVLIGGGGTMAATEGKDVELPAGTVLRVRLDAPLTLAK
jgi:hypothetical protein